MSVRKTFVFGAALLLGMILGFTGSWIIQIQGEKSMAKANIYAAGEALRSGDLVTSMLYAQSIIAHAPKAYDGYEIVGDVYSKQGYGVGAKRMYELALERLNSDGKDALLVQEGAHAVEIAAQLLQRKIASFEEQPDP